MAELRTKKLAKEVAVAAKTRGVGRGHGRGRGRGRGSTAVDTPTTSGASSRGRGGRGARDGRGRPKKIPSSSDDELADDRNMCCVCNKIIAVDRTHQTCGKCGKNAHIDCAEKGMHRLRFNQ